MLVSMEGSLSYSDILNMPYATFIKFIEMKSNLEKEKLKRTEKQLDEAKKNKLKMEAENRQANTKNRLYNKGK